MKRINGIIAIILSCSLVLSACGSTSQGNSQNTVAEVSENVEQQSENTTNEESSTVENSENDADVVSDMSETLEYTEIEVPDLEFSSLNDADLLQYVEDKIYSDLENEFSNDDYRIEEVQVVYISQEYLNELEYNSRKNVYFGYTLEDIESQFDGTKFVFTLGDDGTTVVEPFEDYDDTFDQIVRNVAIGGGVILICVTVSVISGGLGAPAVSMVFAAAAKTGTVFALQSGVFSAAVSAAVTGYQTRDPEATLRAAALSGSEGFKWGAITGSVLGGAEEVITLRNAAQAGNSGLILGQAEDVIPTPREAELLALEEYGGSEQITYIAGEEVAWGTPGGTRPDVVRVVGDHIEAIEVKNYDLVNNSNELYRELVRQIGDRTVNLPAGSTQRIVLNVQGRGYTAEFVNTIVENIQFRLMDIYPNIPVDVMGAVL